MIRYFPIRLAIILLLLCSSAVRGDWSWTLPPQYLKPTSAKRNHVFFQGETVQFTVGAAAATFEARDYYGQLVDSGSIAGSGSRSFNVHATKPGWYKLYLYGTLDQGAPWGKVVGGTTFMIFRPNPNFPALPPASTAGATKPSDDQIMRSVTGMGPQRLAVDDASKPTEAIAKLEQDIAMLKQMYTAYDPVRHRDLMVAFPNGTADLVGVRQIVDRFKKDVKYWEGRNEPDHTISGALFATTQMIPFYETVKSVDPSLKVMGPAITSITPKMSPWIAQFLFYGLGKFDVFDFHAYNCVNGDPWLARQALTDLNTLLRQYSCTGIEKWQTEQGYMAAVYGSYQPRLQGRWTMVQMMMYEQFGIPKEHNHIWYDRSHGYWSFPMWWENEDGGLNPAAPLMRVWSEELYGTTFSRAYDFGAAGNNLYIGSLFTGVGKSVAAFMSAGNPRASIQLTITGSNKLNTVSPFGETSQLTVTNGNVRLPINELPTYVELQAGQTCEVVPPVFGTNVAALAGVTIQASGLPEHPMGSTIPNSTSKLNNGKLENWYYTQVSADHPWMSNVTTWPATIEFDLPQTENISDVIIYAGVPWQSMSTLLDYELQYWNGTAWTTIEHVTEPANTWKVYTPAVRCTVDSYFSDRWVFEHRFPTVSTNKVRIVVNNVTYGGGATADVVAAGGQTGPHQIVLREVEIRRAPTAAAPEIINNPTSKEIMPGGSATLDVTAWGSGPFTYSWSKNGAAMTGATNAQLTLQNVGLDTQANYTVTVTNAAGSATSKPAFVKVKTAFSQWADSRFSPAQLSDPRLLLGADPDGCSIAVLLQYFFNLRTSVVTGIQTVQPPRMAVGPGPTGDFAYFNYEANPSATDVKVAVECRDFKSAVGWQPIVPDLIETLGINPVTGNKIMRLKLKKDHLNSRFFRLKLQIP